MRIGVRRILVNQNRTISLGQHGLGIASLYIIIKLKPS